MSDGGERNVLARISYDGTDFHGWQCQPGVRTVEGVLEAALSDLEGATVDVAGSSRTDQGVHALGQAATFASRSCIPVERFAAALNGRLPHDVRVLRAEIVSPGFHARHSARGKCYRYWIDRSLVPNVLAARYALHEPDPLNLEKLLPLCIALEGEHDFAAFQCESGQSPSTTIRTVDAILVVPEGSFLLIEIWGRSFLYKMVRSIVGTLLNVARGRWGPDRVLEALESRDRKLAGPTAPAHGLVLSSVWFDLESFLKEARSRREAAARAREPNAPGGGSAATPSWGAGERAEGPIDAASRS